MPRPRILVTDFDGTITAHDFYKLVVGSLLTPSDIAPWQEYRDGKITLLAALQQIPTEQVEAAAMDGANAWRRFVNVSLPAIRPVMASITSLNVIWNFNSFGLVYVMTEGGPGGRTMLPMLFTYLEAFKSRNLGYASAMGCVLVLIVVLLLAIYLWSQFREKEAK